MKIWILLTILLIGSLLGCASIGPPPGGPEDIEPPRIESIYPPSGSTSLDPLTTIELTFSEPITLASLTEALFITPTSKKKPRIKLRGRMVLIQPTDPIPSDGTMVITIGTGVRDLHGNQMVESFSIALTAGDQLDYGQISGEVFVRDKLQGILVGAWRTDDTLRINPTGVAPPLMTQTGRNGSYRFEYLPAGTYRIFCWDDKDRDRLYKPNLDRLGLPWTDVELAADGGARLDLHPIVRDTTQLRPLMVSAPDNRHITIRFSRKIADASEYPVQAIKVQDSTGYLHIIEHWWNIADSTRLAFYTKEQIGGVGYRISFPSVDTLEMPVTGSPQPDTLGPGVVNFYPAKRSDRMDVTPEGWIGFDDALMYADFSGLCSLVVSDSVTVPVRAWLESPTVIRWRSEGSLPLRSECRLYMDMTGISDRIDNSSPDSLWTTSFRIVDPSDMGSISGTVFGGYDGAIIVAACGTGASRSKELSTYAESDGSFVIGMLEESDYIVWAFEDQNSNGRYDFGRLDPFEFAERFTLYEDTLSVRLRWETAGIDVRFKSNH